MVICSEEQELARLLFRNALSEEKRWVRIHAQPSVEKRLPLVDEVIDNSGTLEETRSQVAAAFERFCKQFSA